jgi:hypothetical protein
MVSSLIDSNSHCWKQELLEQLFDSTTKEAINKITIPLRPRNDKIVWLLEKNGLFSVKSAYNLCQNLPNTNQNAVEWSKIWKLKAHERSKIFYGGLQQMFYQPKICLPREWATWTLYAICAMKRLRLACTYSSNVM